MGPINGEILLPFFTAVAVAVSAWCIAKEEIFKPLRDFCEKLMADRTRSLMVRKLAYMPTCEYCCSFWVTLFFMLVFRTGLCFPDPRGLLLAHFVTWGLAVFYMALFQLTRVEIRHEQVMIEEKEND